MLYMYKYIKIVCSVCFLCQHVYDFRYDNFALDNHWRHHLNVAHLHTSYLHIGSHPQAVSVRMSANHVQEENAP